MFSVDITNALKSLVPTAEWVHNKEGLKWLSPDILQPTQSEIDAEIVRLQTEYDSQEYARNRKAEYDQLNQFEMQFDDQLNGTTTWVDAINAIKQEFPK